MSTLTPKEAQMLAGGQPAAPTDGVCPRCRQAVEEADFYCRYCGKPLRPRLGFWYDHSGILLLALIAGPFALFTVWMSRKISINAKLLWTAGIVFISIYLLYAFYQSYLMVKEAMNIMLSGAL